jgi:arylsulfatase A-like enzyme
MHRTACRSHPVWLWLCTALLSLSVGCGDPPGERPNVLLISLDTTRVDRLGCYGYGRDTSPNLDALADESVLYTQAISTSSWTLPAHASLFTGKFVTSHGSRYDPTGSLVLTSAIAGPRDWDRYRVRRLGDEHATLAEVLHEHGYATAAVVGGPWMKDVFGLARGFDIYDDDGISSLAGRRAQEVTDRALRWVENRGDAGTGDNDPFFLFLNYYDPHSPYRPPGRFARRYLTPALRRKSGSAIEKINALYDAEIHYMDHHIGRLLSRLRELDLYRSTWIIVTADHGEQIGEHGEVGHGKMLPQVEIHVPLIIKYPFGEVAPRRADGWIQLTDLMPMILGRLGLPVPSGVQGAAGVEERPPVVAEVYPVPPLSSNHHGDWRSLIDGNYKFAWNSDGNHMLFRLDEDPDEANNLAQKLPARAEAMQRTLLDFIASLPLPMPPSEDEVEVDAETRESLRNLGYLE